MTKKESILLDDLLKDFTKPEYKGNAGMVNIKKVINGNDKLKKLSESELKKLLYIIRKEQIKIGINLITGESIFLTYDSHINDFLNNGGFKKKYRKETKELIIKRILQIGGILALIRLIFLGIEYINPLNKKKDDKVIELKSDTLQTTILKDTLPIHYLKKENVQDSLN